MKRCQTSDRNRPGVREPCSWETSVITSYVEVESFFRQIILYDLTANLTARTKWVETWAKRCVA